MTKRFKTSHSNLLAGRERGTWFCVWSSYIDTEHLANIHCFNLWDIKLNPLLSMNSGALIESEI